MTIRIGMDLSTLDAAAGVIKNCDLNFVLISQKNLAVAALVFQATCENVKGRQNV